MQHSGHSVAVLDANVLYPAPVRDILLSLAREKLFRPKWIETINQEWSANLKKNRPDIDSIAIRNTLHQMETAFPVASLHEFDIEPVHPDDFIINLIDLNDEIAFKASQKMVARLKNPPLSEADVLKALEKCGLKKTVKRISQRT